MGTDIHLAVEKKNADGTWSDVSSVLLDPYDQSYELYPSQRNYTLFGYLADVRNGVGFAGVKTGEPVDPLFPARGIPADSTYTPDGLPSNVPRLPDGKVDYDQGFRSLGDHSLTYATLEELAGVQWDVVVTSQGVLSEAEYLKWEAAGRSGAPDSWSGSVWGPGIQMVSEKDYRTLRSKVVDEADGASGLQGWLNHVANSGIQYQVKISWKWQPLIDCNFSRWVKWLVEKEGPNADVRVLIGFDS